MRKLTPLRLLQAFEAVGRLGGFKSAAAKLHVTPTAIRHQVRLLESTCGHCLLPRHFDTSGSHRRQSKAVPWVAPGFDTLIGAAALIANTGTLVPPRVTSPNVFASRCLVARLADWQDRYPDIPLEVIGTDAILVLRSGDADMAVRYVGTMPTGFVACEISAETFFSGLQPSPAGEGWAGDRACVGPAALFADTLRLMTWDPQAPTWRQWLATVRPDRIRREFHSGQ